MIPNPRKAPADDRRPAARRTRWLVLSALCWGTLAFSAQAADDVFGLTPELRREHKLTTYYAQGVHAGKLLVLGSDQVRPEALLEARRLIRGMLAGAPRVETALADAGVRVTVMAPWERTTNVPEHAFLKPKEYWDRRARGLGATPRAPVASCGEENLLGYEGDPYRSENILIHEFSHGVHEVGMASIDPAFDELLRATHQAAIVRGLWDGTYAATDHKEYFAEGTQAWFDCNAPAGGVHNGIRTREQLQDYDKSLAALLADVYGDNPWRYARPTVKLPGEPRRFTWEGTNPPPKAPEGG